MVKYETSSHSFHLLVYFRPPVFLKDASVDTRLTNITTESLSVRSPSVMDAHLPNHIYMVAEKGNNNNNEHL